MKPQPDTTSHDQEHPQQSQQELERIQQQLHDLQEHNRALTQELESVYASRSWRITAPLRQLLHQRHLHRQAQRQSAQPLPGSRLSRHLGRLLHRIAHIGWMRRIALRLLGRFPAVKHRLQRLLAQVPGSSTAIIRSYGHADDFEDILPVEKAPVRQLALHQRDTLLPVRQLLDHIQAISLQGHFNGSYSLAAVNRHLIHRLRTDLPALQLALQPHEGVALDHIDHTSADRQEVATLNSLVGSQRLTGIKPERRINLYHHYPLITDTDSETGLPIAIFFWEESLIPQHTIDTLNAHYAGVLVTAWFVKKALMDSGCTLPIQVVTLPLQGNPHAANSQRSDLARIETQRQITLLHVSSCFPRKGPDVLLEAFEHLAARLDNVRLVIKTFPNPHNHIEQWLEQYLSPAHRTRVTLIQQEYDAQAMAELYHQADIVVLPTRGEGLNLPGIEAGEFSRLLVVTGHGAHTDFAWNDNSRWISYRLAPAQTHLAEGLSVWADPDPQHLAEQLHVCCKGLLHGDKILLTQVTHLNNHIRQRFHAAQASDAFLSGLWRLQRYHQQGSSRQQAPHISLITTWGEPCGIAEYTRYLVAELVEQGCPIHLSIPRGRRQHHEQLDQQLRIDEEWLHGQPPELRWCQLPGDIVWLQHHFAFYPLDRRLAGGVEYLRGQGKRLYITLHTTGPLLQFEKGRQQSAVVCLSAFDRVYVHTVHDLNTLKRLGLIDNVTLMPQGVHAVATAGQGRAEEQAPTIGSFGFLLPHKGVDLLIEAFAQARQRRVLPAESRLRLVTAVRDDTTSPHELERCQRLAKRLKVADSIDWHTDFLPLPEVEQLLAECQLLILPYQFTLESSSAAVRTAVAANPHVATTPAPIFDEVRDITIPIDGYDSQAIYRLLKAHVGEPDPTEQQQRGERRSRWLEQRHWPLIAGHYRQQFQAALIDHQLELASHREEPTKNGG